MLEPAQGPRQLVSKMRRILPLLPVLGCLSATTALAQRPAQVRVVNATTIREWYGRTPTDVGMAVEAGTILDVIDEDGGRYWVFQPRDAHGTTRGGWIAVTDVEAVETPSQESSARRLREDAAPPAAIAPPVQEAAPSPPREVVRESPAAREPAIDSASYHFEDVLFDLDRAVIKPEAAAILDQATAALTNDRLLRLTIEGYTCNLGTAAHNLALGERRAVAARDYLVSHGVAADRLHTVSYGEEHPAHDNSREESRRLNRRVVLVPDAAQTPGTATSR